MIEQGGFVYIMTNANNSVLYTGVSFDLEYRVWQHKNHYFPKSFTSKYKCNKLAYFHFYDYIEDAIEEEKRIKGGSRQAKIDLVNGLNSQWLDLYEDLFE